MNVEPRLGRSARVLIVVMLFAAGLGTGPTVRSNESYGEDPPAAGDDQRLWFVELNSPPTADGTSPKQTGKERAAFRAAARESGVDHKERHAFEKLWNGFSVEIEPTDLSRLARVEGVKGLYPVHSIALPETQTVEPQMATAMAMTGADVVHGESSLTGNGVRVGIIDTGVDYHHPDLGGCFGPGCRVFTGYDFVGDSYTGTKSTPPPSPDVDPDDCGGHGTHVAGIVGANGGVNGVAPGVTFGAYRIFGCSGVTNDDLIIAGLERALADGMDVVNLSLGEAFSWGQDPAGQAATRLVNKGVVVVAAMGNSTDNSQSNSVISDGLYSGSSPGVAQKVIGVASLENNAFSRFFTISPDDTPIGFAPAGGSASPPSSGTEAMARTGTVASTEDACFALRPESLLGHVALVRLGGCSPGTQAANVRDAGATAMVAYGFPGQEPASVFVFPPTSIPVVMISGRNGELIDSRLADGAVSLTWSDQVRELTGPGLGLISDFSSFGPAPDLTVKPDIAAPGGYVHSTIPVEDGSYATLSGTSMASPHVAGAAALLLEARPNIPAQEVGPILQNAADPVVWRENPGLGAPDVVHRQGAGLLDIDDAITSALEVRPATLALGESETGAPVQRAVTITNSSQDDVVVEVGHTPAIATSEATGPLGSLTPKLDFHAASADVVFDPPRLTVPAGGSAIVNVTVRPPSDLNRGEYGGYIVLTQTREGPTYRVPYVGFAGDYQSLETLFRTTPSGAITGPELFRRYTDGSSDHITADGETFTLVNDVPWFIFALYHQATWFRLDVFEVGGRSWGRILERRYAERLSGPVVYGITWDGITKRGRSIVQVPDGRYVVKLTSLKALGDAANPAHVESWTSPVFIIDRPDPPSPIDVRRVGGRWPGAR